MNSGNFGWIELVLFYGIAIGFGVWQFWKTDRLLKRTRAANAAKEAAEQDGRPAATTGCKPSLSLKPVSD